jgi:hypothetical protein
MNRFVNNVLLEKKKKFKSHTNFNVSEDLAASNFRVKMKVAVSFETSVTYRDTTRQHNEEGLDFGHFTFQLQ